MFIILEFRKPHRRPTVNKPLLLHHQRPILIPFLMKRLLQKKMGHK